MGFLDNSGDIILDAVLTDTGRMRLAKGDGSFKIVKFALGDDEIDYGLYDKNHASGSAYYDINILQTPVLESFTNNMSSMKSRLLSYSANDLLYLPVILTNTNMQAYASGLNSYVVLADQNTVDHFTTNATGGSVNTLADGLLNGNEPPKGAHYVVADQGLDTIELSADQSLEQYDTTLVETSYFVQVDNRLASLVPVGATATLDPSSVDDDQIATYIVSLSDGGTTGQLVQTAVGESVIRGPLGTRVQFKLASSLNLKTSSFLFDQLGSTGTVAIASGGTSLAAASYKFIDTTVRISGVATGYSLDIPLRFVRKN
tara:strand:- start:2775 stop:3722 length:948 start_codon:yes stop_codon:yes gene_type:complete